MQRMSEIINLPTANTEKHIDRTDEQIESFNSSEGQPDLLTQYDCPICKNKRMIAFNQNGYFTTRACECEKIRTTIKNLKNSGLGAVDKNTFENYSTDEKWQEEILKSAKNFASAPLGNWFFIGGQVGAGKTHIGKASAYEYIKKGILVKYLEWKKDIQYLNAIINTPEYEKEFSKFVFAPVLYIDDFLKSFNKSAFSGAVNRASDLIYSRYTQEDTTVIISSELMIDDIIEIDEGMGSRIVEKTKPLNSIINLKPDKSKNYRLK